MTKILFLGKSDNEHCDKAAAIVRKRFADPLIRCSKRGDEMPSDAANWRGDYIISFLSPFVLPQEMLDRATKAAINFHPGPPEYPGIGCTNFAIYDEVSEFGITCHHMARAVDTGPVIDVRRFPVTMNDSVLDLTLRCYDHILECFEDIIEVISEGRDLPVSDEHWTRRAYTRRELNELCRIESEMSEREIKRRIRATVFPNAPGPFIELYGARFEYRAPSDN